MLWKGKSFGRSRIQSRYAVLIGFFAATLTEVSGQRNLSPFSGLETGKEDADGAVQANMEG